METVEYEISLRDMFTRTMTAAEHGVETFEKKVEGAKERITEMGKEIAGAFVAFEAGEFLKSSAEEFMDAQKNVERLSLAVSKRGGLASDMEELREEADKLQDKGIFDDDEALKLDQLGLQMGLTVNKVKELTPLIEDVAARTGDATATVLEDILHGAAGMERGLMQFGIHIKDTGSKTKNLALIVDQLKRSYAGANEEMANTTDAGRIANLTNEWKDFQKEVGGDLMEVMHELLPELKAGIADLKEFAHWVHDNGSQIKEWTILIGEAWVAFKVIAGGAAILDALGIATGAATVAAEGLATAETTAAEGVTTMNTAMVGFKATLGEVLIAITAIRGIYDVLSSESSLSVANINKSVSPHDKEQLDKYAETDLQTKQLELSGNNKYGPQYAGAFLKQQYESQMQANKKIIEAGKDTYGGTYGSMRLAEIRDIGSRMKFGGHLSQIKGHPGEDAYKKAVLENADLAEKIKHLSDIQNGAVTPPGTAKAPGKEGTDDKAFDDDKTNKTGKDSVGARMEGQKVQNFNIQIGDLVKEFNVRTTNINEAPAKVKQLIVQSLVDAVNDSQHTGGH